MILSRRLNPILLRRFSAAATATATAPTSTLFASRGGIPSKISPSRLSRPRSLRPPSRPFSSGSSAASSLVPPLLFAVAGCASLYLVNNFDSFTGVGTLPEVSDSGLSAPQAKITDVVWMDVSVKGAGGPTARIELGLYGGECPRTVANFVALAGEGVEVDVPNEGKRRKGFKGTPFHRVIPGFMMQGGDITQGNGFGGYSLYGDKFPDER